MKILIADDESIIRMGMKSMLTELGHTVFAAKNGKDALTQFDTYHPDLAILDIRMPLLDGMDTAKRLYGKRPIPIIFLTGDSNRLLLSMSESAPFHATLIKPVRGADDLIAAIAVATNVFRREQEADKQKTIAEKRLADQKIVDRARLMLIQRGMTEQEAHTHIQKMARSTNQKQRDVAAELIIQCQAEALLVEEDRCSYDEAAKKLTEMAAEHNETILETAEGLVTIDRAVKKLMKKSGITEKQAHAYIARLAIDSRKEKRVVAAAILKK